MATIQVVNITNPRLSLPAFDFRTVTEKRDLLRKLECAEDLPDGDGLSSTDEGYPCQRGCGTEFSFFYLVEAGDTIPLQFHAADNYNANPQVPTAGWRVTDPAYWLSLEILDGSGNLIWEGSTADLSTSFHVGFGEFGGYQNVVVDVDKLLAVLAGIPYTGNCFSFRLKARSLVAEYITVNGEERPGDTSGLPVGWTTIDIDTFEVLEWNGTAFVVIEPNPPTGNFYVAETGQWYGVVGGGFVGLLEPPAVEEEAFEYLYTMGYRFRLCNEPAVLFESEQGGKDCAGFIHQVGDATFVGLAGITTEAFQHRFKVKGSLEAEALPFSRELTKNNRLVRTSTDRTSRLRTRGMPHASARLVQAVVTADAFTIDGQAWDEVEGLQRNNDQGLMWWLNVLVTRQDCEASARC